MRHFLLSLLIAHLAACSSLQSISVQDVQSQGEDSGLYIGDRVEIITNDSERLDFAVTDITNEGIGGKFGLIPYANIRSLKVKRPGSLDDSSETWVWAVLGAVALGAIIASADSVTVCSGDPCP
jgi:protein involved in temperature-dependent protein secretion